jgi:hypothetical protein
MSETEELDKGPFKPGRPFKFADPEALKQSINAYFDSCDPHVADQVVDGGINGQGETIWIKRAMMTQQKPYRMSGLARAIGASRTTLLKYKDAEYFSDDISDVDRQAIMTSLTQARNRVEEFAEGNLFSPYSNGAKFALINNYKGWADKIVQEHEGGFFNAPHRLEVEIVNPEPLADETETEPDAEPGTPATS